MRLVAIALAGAWIVVSAITDIGAPRNADLPLLAGADAPGEIRSIIDRSCRDCHSEATKYPWYSYIAPVSLVVHDDIRRGREHLNFSRWSEYSLLRRERCLSEIANQVQDGGMPIAIYTFLHRGAKLSQADVDALFAWTQAERARLISENQHK